MKKLTLKTVIQENFIETKYLNTHIEKDHQALEKINPQDILVILQANDQVIYKGKRIRLA